MLKRIISCGGFSDNNCLVVVLYHTVVLLWSGHNSFHTEPVDRLSVGRGIILFPPDHFINQISGRTKPHYKNKATLALTWPCGEDLGSVLKYDRKAAVLSSLSIHITLSRLQEVYGGPVWTKLICIER